MRHLIPLTKDQLQIVQASLQLSLKYADSQYIDNATTQCDSNITGTACIVFLRVSYRIHIVTHTHALLQRYWFSR